MLGRPAMVIEGCGGYGEPQMSVNGLGVEGGLKLIWRA